MNVVYTEAAAGITAHPGVFESRYNISTPSLTKKIHTVDWQSAV